MTRVTIYTSGSSVRGFEACGHAGARRVRGVDLVCCAVSTLTQAGVNALETVAGVVPQVTVEDGFLRCILPDGIEEVKHARAQIVLQTVISGLKDIEQVYPNLVRIKQEEWRQADA